MGQTSAARACRVPRGYRPCLQREAFFASSMAHVDFTKHLTTLFPQLSSAPLSLQASTLAELIDGLEQIAPGVAFYICDERGRLRRHVNIFVDNEMLVDRKTLSDQLANESQVFIAQALSGGSSDRTAILGAVKNHV